MGTSDLAQAQTRMSSTSLAAARTDQCHAPRAERWRRLAVAAQDPSLDNVLDHIDYLMALVGDNHIAFGPDFVDYMSDYLNEKLRAANVGYLDSPDYPRGITGVHQFHNITAGLLDRGYSEASIRKILGENYLRVCDQAMS